MTPSIIAWERRSARKENNKWVVLFLGALILIALLNMLVEPWVMKPFEARAGYQDDSYLCSHLGDFENGGDERVREYCSEFGS